MKIKGWHFSAKRMRDGTPLPAQGVVLRCDPVRVNPCHYGYHASIRAIDALMYAPGPYVARVELSDLVIPHGNPVDKYVSSKREALTAYVDATKPLRPFARQCAQDVLHMWNPPEIVVKFLETGDEALREATWAAAMAAVEVSESAREATWAAAMAAVEVSKAAAGDAVRAAAWAAAWAAAGAAAGDAARAAQNERLERLLNELLNILEQEDYL